MTIMSSIITTKLRKQPNEKPHKTAIIACINRLLKQFIIL